MARKLVASGVSAANARKIASDIVDGMLARSRGRRSLEEWDKIVEASGTQLARITLAGRELPRSKLPRDKAIAERDRLQRAQDRAFDQLIGAVTGRDRERARIERAQRAPRKIDGVPIMRISAKRLRAIQARNINTIGKMVGSLYPALLMAENADIDAELKRREAVRS